MNIYTKIKQQIKNKLTIISTHKPYIFGHDYKNLEGKIAIVTGGSGVIGRSIAFKLASMGAKVYIFGTNQDKLNFVVSAISQQGGMADCLLVNLKSEEEIKESFDFIFSRENKIDILINCAGGSSREKNSFIFDLPSDVINEVLDVNLKGTIFCCREASKYMLKARNGNIICITSIIAERGKAKFSEYAAAKAGIIAFVKSIAMELGPLGIKVNSVSPGIVPRGSLNGDQIEMLKKTNFVNDYGKPEDIANMVGYLVTDEASFITGQNFIIDGGRSLGLKGD